jgi:hypothetical protein
MDPTKMRNEDLEPKEVKMRVRDLFNLKDPSFRKLTVIELAFKLTRCGGINPRYHKMIHGPHHLRWPSL